MGFLSSLGSSLGSVFGGSGISLSDATFGWSDYSSGQSKYKYQLSRAVSAEKELAEYMAKNGATWNVAGLRAAGINPMLAVNGGNIGDTHSMSASASMPSSSAGIGSSVRSKLDRAQQESAIDANSALADKTKADELKTLVSSLNDLQDGGSKGIEGIARMAGRSFGEDRDIFGALAEGIGKRLGKLLGVSAATSAKDRRSEDGKVSPAPNSAKSSSNSSKSSGDRWEDTLDDDSRRALHRLRRRDFVEKYRDKKYGDVQALHFGH